MLAVTELAEAAEGHRKGLQDDKLPQYPMSHVELVDTAVRIFDLSGGLGVSFGEILAAKMEYNAHRLDHKPEYRQGPGGKAY